MIRAATSEDVSAIASLIDASYRVYVPALGRDPQPMTDDYADLVASGEVSVLIEQQDIAGVLVLQDQKDALLVRTVGIAPAYQGRGLGRRLMAYAEERAAACKKKALRLYTNEVMTGNVDLYRWLGYSETHRTGPDKRQVVHMTKVLHG